MRNAVSAKRTKVLGNSESSDGRCFALSTDCGATDRHKAIQRMKQLVGSIENLRREYKLYSAKNNVQSYNGYRFEVDGRSYMLWVNTVDPGPTLREGERVDMMVSDGDLVDRFGSNAVYAIRLLDDHRVYVCHRNMSFFRGRARITSMSYANFKDARNTVRVGLLLAVLVFVGLSLWQDGTARLSWVVALLAPLILIAEGGLDLYDFRWRSRCPSQIQQRTLQLYAMLNAGTPLNPAAGVYPI